MPLLDAVYCARIRYIIRLNEASEMTMLMSNERQTNDVSPSRISTTISRPGRTDADYLIMVRKINTSISEFEILLVLIHHSHGTTRAFAQRIIACRASSG